MTDFQFGNVTMLHGLWIVPGLALLMLYASRRRRQALRRFVHDALLARVQGTSRPDPARRVLKGTLVLGAVALLVIALARPAWNEVVREVSQRGRDVVFLLDVSRSMLAEDLPPNRLERAKLSILDAVDRLDGDRVALAVFAGSTVVKCPLTLDYGFFRMALDDATPLSVTRGGSLIGDGLRTVLNDVFDGKRSNHRDVVLITDGEDHESFPVEAAAEAGELGVRLIAIGLGDERVGHRIPVATDASGGSSASQRSFLQHQGQEVWSRLDADTLRKMADSTPGGRYLNVATGTIDFGTVYRRLIATAEGREIGSRTIGTRDEKFQIFLAICLLLLALEIALREHSATRRTAALALVLGFAPSTAPAASVRGLVNEGNELYRAESYDDAIQSYDEALERDPSSPHAALNRANALYRSGRFEEAAEAYSEAVQRSAERQLPQLEAAGLHNLGNALYRQAEGVAQSNPGRALDLLAPAARSYADALRANAGRVDSAHNLEMARRLIQQLRKQASQQQSGGESDSNQQSEQDESQDSQDSRQQAAEEQEELAQESQDLARDQDEHRDSASRQRQQQKAQELADRQKELSDRTEELSQDAQPDSQQQFDEAKRHQQDAEQALDENRMEDAARSQQAAAQALRVGPGEEQTAQSPQPSQPADEGEEQAEQQQAMTMEEILAKEQQDRRDRQLQRVGIVAVEKDW